ncbi:MAG: Gfo/Idh/MocA family oxidoreductase [Candidatus Firestonebacteria bacterium]
MEKVRFGVIGCGVIAPWHINGILGSKGAELIAVSDNVAEKAKKTGEEYKVDWYDDYKKMIERKDIDAVTIGVPSGLHMQIALEAMQAGKHVLTEKPIEVTLEKIDKMIETSKKTGKKLACVFQGRYFENAKKIKETIEQGKFGKVVLGDMYNKWYRSPEYYKSSGWRATLELDGGGALMNQAIHGIDLLLYYMGDVASVSAYAATLTRDIKVEDTAVAVLRFKSGALGVIEGTTSIYPGFSRKIEILGEKGSVVLEDNNTIVKWQFEGEEDLTSKFEDSTKSVKATASASATAMTYIGHTMQIQDFTNAILQGKQPEVNPVDARKSVEIILAIYKSSKERKEIKLG